MKQREAAEQRACAAEALTTAAEQRYAAAEQRCAAAEQRAAAAERAVEALVRRLEAAERHAEREAATRLATALAAARADAEVQMGLRVDAACRDVRTACEQASTQQLHALQAAANSACVVAEDGRQAAEAACAAAERRALLAEEAHARELLPARSRLLLPRRPIPWDGVVLYECLGLLTSAYDLRKWVCIASNLF